MIKDSLYIDGLVDYIKDVKPYSSKLLDVSVEYQFSDTVSVIVQDNDHHILSKLNAYWLKDYSYDGSTLLYKIPAALYPRRDSDIHQLFVFTAGAGATAGVPNPQYDRANTSTDPIYHTPYLENAYRVRGNDGVIVKVNGVRVIDGVDYKTTYEDSNGDLKFLGPHNSVIQFIDTNLPPNGAKITIDTYRNDSVYVAFGNYDGSGHPNYSHSENTDPTIINFVPYILDENPSADIFDPYYGWGGSANVDPNAPPEIPVLPSFNPDYDMEGYDLFPYEDNAPIDEYDYANGISNWDTGPWDGNEFADEGSSLVTDFYDDSYMPSVPEQSYIDRKGRLIGQVKRLADSNNQYFYVFQFDKSYLDEFVPIGTKITIGVKQDETEHTRVGVGIREEIHFKEKLKFFDNIKAFVTDNRICYNGYDIGWIDWPRYDYVTPGNESIADSGVPCSQLSNVLKTTSKPKEADTISQRISEEFVLVSYTGSYGVDYDVVPYDTKQADVIVTLSNPMAQSGTFWQKSFTEPISSLRIVHNMGDTDPLGPYANTGGVIVEITGTIPTAIENPYINNVPKLFIATDITFELPSTFTIKITKR